MNATGGNPAVRRTVLAECPICGHGAWRLFWKDVPDLIWGLPFVSDYVRCRCCGSVYQNPAVIPEDLHLLYPEHYYTHSSAGGDSNRSADSDEHALRLAIQKAVTGERGPWWGKVAARIRPLRERAFHGLPDVLIPRSSNPGRALEVGSGQGVELSALSKAGWKAQGIEWDPEAAQVASDRSGCRLDVGDYLLVDLRGRLFDLIYLGHVFEHLPSPAKTADFFARHLAPGGRAVIIMPNIEGLGANWWGRLWPGGDPPRHLVLPTRKGLSWLAASHGLEVEFLTLSRLGRSWSAWARKNGGKKGGTSFMDWMLAGIEYFTVLGGMKIGEELVATFRVEKP